MAKAKKISYKNIVANLPEREVVTLELQGEILDGMTLQVKRRLTMPEMTALMNDIVNTIVDYSEGAYTPEFADLVRQIFVLKHYAGISIGEKELTAAYRVLGETSLYSQVCEFIDQDQLHEMYVTTEDRIDYLRQMMISTASIKVMELMAQVEQVTASINLLNDDKIQELVSAMSNISDMVGVSEENVEEVPVEEVYLN